MRSSSWLLLTIAEFWEDKLFLCSLPCMPFGEVVPNLCPVAPQGDHFLSFVVRRYW